MKTTSIIITTLALLISAGLTSCSKSDSEETTQNTDEKTDTPQYVDDKGEALTPAQEQAFGKSINDFTFNMFRTMAAEHPRQSLVSSPLSAATLLAMLNDGAWGKTREELLKVLGFEGAKSRSVNEYFQKLMDTTTDDATTKLQMANAVYVRRGYEFKTSFVDDMKLYYSADVATLDFDKAETIKYINDWCSDKTNKMIPEIIQKLPSDALSIMIDALYFKGEWKNCFFALATHERTFTLEDGTQCQLMTMHDSRECDDYLDTTDYQALRLKYGNGSYNMTILLPKKGKTVSDVVGGLTADSWKTLQSKMGYPGTLVNISLPRFTVQTTEEAADLKGMLSKMGVNGIFSAKDAELPNILNVNGLYIDQIKQKAVIKVTEIGTEAAAITYDFSAGSSGEVIIPIDFYADHPFVYVISNSKTGVVYFIGQYHGE